MIRLTVIIFGFSLLVHSDKGLAQCYFIPEMRENPSIAVGYTDMIGIVSVHSDSNCGGGANLDCMISDPSSGFSCSVTGMSSVVFGFSPSVPGPQSATANIHFHEWHSGGDCCWRDTSITLEAIGLGFNSASSDLNAASVSVKAFRQSLFLQTRNLNITEVSVKLFDLTGRLVRLIEGECARSTTEMDLDGRTLPPGCYWYIARSGDWQQSGKVMKFE